REPADSVEARPGGRPAVAPETLRRAADHRQRALRVHLIDLVVVVGREIEIAGRIRRHSIDRTHRRVHRRHPERRKRPPRPGVSRDRAGRRQLRETDRKTKTKDQPRVRAAHKSWQYNPPRTLHAALRNRAALTPSAAPPPDPPATPAAPVPH